MHKILTYHGSRRVFCFLLTADEQERRVSSSNNINNKGKLISKCNSFEKKKVEITTSKYFTYLGFVVERTEENGGNLTFKDYASLEQAFAQKVSNCLLGYLQLPYHVETEKKKLSWSTKLDFLFPIT